MESLIYDRTLSDITNLTSKGQYNASDLNRVESWTKHLNDKFNELGYRTGNIKIYGKNVFNPAMFDGLTVNADGTVKSNKYYKDSVATTLTLEPNTEYTIRTFINGVSSTNVGFSLEVNGTWVNYTWANFKTDENGEITLRVGAGAYATIGIANFDVMMRKTTDDNVYVPYKEPVVGYKERPITVDYIESTGTQYIDTGIIPNSNTKVEVKFMATTTNNTGIFGARESMETYGYLLWGYLGGQMRFDYNADSYTPTFVNNISHNTIYTVTKDKNLNYINGVQQASQSEKIFECPVSMYLFGINGNSTADIISPCKIYYCKIYDNDSLLRDFIPAIDPNGVVCLYDKVSKTYFYNKGTGNFKVGYKELTKPVYEVKDFTDTSLFNAGQNSTRTLVKEETPISNSFIRLTKTQ